MLGMFANPLNADDKYSLLHEGDLLLHIQMQLSQKEETIS